LPRRVGRPPCFERVWNPGRELAEAGSPILRHIFAAGRHPKWLEVPPHKFGWQPIPANVPNNEYSLLLVFCNVSSFTKSLDLF
jgi:hypothetical protein